MAKAQGSTPEQGGLSGAPPIPIAVLLCDQMVVDRETNKKSLIGVFNAILAPRFPWVHPKASLYIKMADAEGEYEVKLQLVRVRDMHVIKEGTGTLKVEQRKRYSEVDFAIDLPAIELPEPGEYQIVVYINGHYFHRARFEAVLKEG